MYDTTRKGFIMKRIILILFLIMSVCIGSSAYAVNWQNPDIEGDQNDNSILVDRDSLYKIDSNFYIVWCKITNANKERLDLLYIRKSMAYFPDFMPASYAIMASAEFDDAGKITNYYAADRYIFEKSDDWKEIKPNSKVQKIYNWILSLENSNEHISGNYDTMNIK